VGVETLRIVPLTVKAGLKQVRAWHRHLPNLQGGLFAAGVEDADGQLRGVAIAGNPARSWQGSGRLVISRVATDGMENACSALYGALCRAAKALGYREVWTYTLPEEPGTSLRAAGFEDRGLTDGGDWDRPSRSRRSAVRSEPKRRWVRRLAAGILLLPAVLQAQPPELSRLGGAVFIGASKCAATEADRTPCAPRWGVGYRLYEPRPWANLTGFIGPQAFGVAACLRFPDYHSAGGHLVSFSVGPGYGMPLDGNGLTSGRLGGLFSVSVRSAKP
jgi:hypothetical protein